MKFGIFYEHQLPKPWTDGAEQKLFDDALDQVELADQLGIDYAWEVEHHFLEEYSHSSAPEVFLAAASQRTKQIRLGHGIMLMPSGYNHPARAAERIATLYLVSHGRVEFGTGESASRAELEGFDIDPTLRREQWRENVEQIANMLAMDPIPATRASIGRCPPATSCRSRSSDRTRRSGLPAPTARPSISLPQLGIGALTFTFVDYGEAKHRVDDYCDTFKNE